MWKSDEGKTVSYWQRTESGLEERASDIPSSVDVCVIGGGIAGLTTAYLLAKEGKSVVVLDDGPIGGGETARTTAHLSWALDDRIYRVAKWHGDEKARLAVESHAAAVDKIEEIVKGENIDCDFSRLDGYLFDAEESEDDLDEELEVVERLGLKGIEFVQRVPIEIDTGRAVRFANQAQFHILKYLSGLAAAIENAGGRLCPHTPATEWSGGGDPRVVMRGGYTIRAKKIVVATNYPLQSKLFPMLAPYRTYAIAVRIPKGSVEKMLLWDTGDPYHYVRTQSADDHDVLIVGGEDHRTGQADDGEERFTRLSNWTKKHFPSAGDVVDKWSGQVFETPDGLGFIGPFSDDENNVFVITGDSGMGMTHSTLGAMLVNDLIAGRENAWAEVYDPSRLATFPIKDTVTEIASSTKPYVDWVTPGEVSSVDEVKPGFGAVLRDGAAKLAVYRDDDGTVHQRSAVCTHMGCIVHFNSAEKTWDCPCHGSRFGIDGHVINSPAMSPLAKVIQKTAKK